MTSETYSPSLTSIHRGLDTEVQEPALVENTGHSKEEFDEVYRTAMQLVLIDTCLQGMSVLPSSLETIGTSFTLPRTSIRRSIIAPARNVRCALSLPAEAMVGNLTKAMVGSLIPSLTGSARNFQPNITVGTSAQETPQVEHRGWKTYIESAEYEARLDAITPRSANNEAEDYVRPTLRGRIRTIRRG